MKHTQWTTAISTNRTDLDFLREIKSYGIHGIELSVAEWECHNIDWQGLCGNADKAEIKVLSYHLPFGDRTDISAADEAVRINAVEIDKALIKKATDTGINRFVIHPSYEPIGDEERQTRMSAAKLSLSELAEYAESFNSVLCVENLPRTCLGHNIAEMQELLSADSRLRVCFDVNHLLKQFGCTHRQFVKALGDKIITCHMSDYDFEDEKHFFCGNGSINWDELIGLLEEAGYCGPFLFEGGFTPHRIFKDVPHGSFAQARERHMNIRNFKGK